MFQAQGISADFRQSVHQVYELKLEFSFIEQETNKRYSILPLFIPLVELYVDGEVKDMVDLSFYVFTHICTMLSKLGKDVNSSTLQYMILYKEEIF